MQKHTFNSFFLIFTLNAYCMLIRYNLLRGLGPALHFQAAGTFHISLYYDTTWILFPCMASEVFHYVDYQRRFSTRCSDSLVSFQGGSRLQLGWVVVVGMLVVVGVAGALHSAHTV